MLKGVRTENWDVNVNWAKEYKNYNYENPLAWENTEKEWLNITSPRFFSASMYEKHFSFHIFTGEQG